MNDSNKLWGGRFSAKTAAIVQAINQSVTLDVRLAQYDISVSKAHCHMLEKSSIITSVECRKIIEGLNQISKQILSGTFEFKLDLEDIHMNIEAALGDIIGEVAGKLHTARSRNDQVVTDFKLWIRDALKTLAKKLYELQQALLIKAEENVTTFMPGFTHFQPAQPIVFGHHLLAYFEMFTRDQIRIKNALVLLNECPLGACALAGTAFPIDRTKTSEELGFTKPTTNSLDSVSDRDFVVDYLYVVALCAVHLSRLAEELIIWNSPQFGFIKLSDAYTTGSSIMPQKRNPDALELIRGKVGTILGNLQNVLVMLKGLTLGYSKDMQEDKAPVFSSHDTIILSITALTEMIKDMYVDKQKMYEAAHIGYIVATDLADWLVRKYSFTFRQAHRITGKIVQLAAEKKLELRDLDLASIQSIEPKITPDVFDILTVESSVNSKTSFGGTAPKNVRSAIKEAKKRLANWQK